MSTVDVRNQLRYWSKKPPIHILGALYLFGDEEPTTQPATKEEELAQARAFAAMFGYDLDAEFAKKKAAQTPAQES